MGDFPVALMVLLLAMSRQSSLRRPHCPVEDDTITVDAEQCVVTLDVSDDELAARRVKWTAPEPMQNAALWQSMPNRSVLPAKGPSRQILIEMDPVKCCGLCEPVKAASRCRVIDLGMR